MFKINSRTSLKSIKAAALDDFGIIISNADAREIRDGARTATISWQSERFINCARSAEIQRMDASGLKTRSGGWSREEWNARMTA